MPTNKYWLETCPFCKALADTRHRADCKLINLVRDHYEDPDNQTIIPDSARVEKVSDGYRVEASVHISCVLTTKKRK